jgi:galactosyl transferase GMA12/MNN10 family
MLNHKIYADRHGYRYRFDLSPTRNITRFYWHKITKIQDALSDADWVFWVDDDIFFTQLDVDFQRLVPELFNPKLHLIFGKSPVNLQGGWTYLTSGSFFIRNSQLSRELLSSTREDLLPTVEKWWDSNRFGIWCESEQDVLVYLIVTNSRFGKATALLEYQRFNTRPYHFHSEGMDHFLVHFTNQPNRSKPDQMHDFAKKFSLTPFMVPRESLEPYGRYPGLLLEMIGGDEWHL